MNKIERNAPCPCGSGKKYKQCCLKQDKAQVTAHSIKPVDKLISTKPSDSTDFFSLGNSCRDQGDLDAAAENYYKAIELKPNYAEAHNNLALVLQEQCKHDEAIKHCRIALESLPNSVIVLSNLGTALQKHGELDAATECLQKAVALQPDYSEAHYNLGNVLQAQGKLDLAIQSYQRSLSLKPDCAEAHYNLGNAYLAQGQLDAAVECYRKALLHKPEYAEAHSNLGFVLKDQGKLDEAIAHYRKALHINPESKVLYNVGEVLTNQGKRDEAIEHYRKGLSFNPNMVDTHSNLLYALNYQPNLSREEIFRAYQEYETMVGVPLRSTWRPHSNDKNPHRRLRVGYVSPDFCRHAVAYFIEPILANHDKSQVETFCYAEVLKEDEVTNRLRPLAGHWNSTVGLNDDAVAQMIRDHQIDILVDLAGHTARNRLMVFARKPAPLQITYLGYLGATGLSAMDYLLIDRHVEPEGIGEAYYVERLLRLPDSLWCYRPSADTPEISPLPALTRGYLTFGSFNNFNKIDHPTIALWADLLRALPTSRLMVLSVPDGEAQQRLLHSFAKLGIDSQRLEFHSKLSIDDFRRKLLEVDLALDPVTVNGGTTTCETLWMGVPVMSLVGDRFASRAGLSILNTVGLKDFAAASREDFLHLAAHLADNLPLLAEIRAGLRAHVAASPLIDEVGFTRNLETLYRDVWGTWCNAT
jgi:predicted O-linked N-acetylglucosamine transferase (SPINDLY family)